MPTGYTADVADGRISDFRTFALRCARNFGATIMQRDDPIDEPPKHREPSTYDANALAEAQAEAARLTTLTVEQAQVEADAEREQRIAEIAVYRGRRAETRARYEAMLAAVRGWTPPTAAHVEMKRFMERQLTESIDFDCTYDEPDPQPVSGVEWLAKRQTSTAKSIEVHAAGHAAELARCAQANAWIDALYASLNGTK